MSLPPSAISGSSSSSAANASGSVSEVFTKYFEGWLVEQNQDLTDLVAASRDESIADSDPELPELVSRVIGHYERYYRSKSRCTKRDVLAMMTPAWRSILEDAFLWIGGWRPSTIFHLLYSKCGLQLEAGLDDLLRGVSTRDLGDLSASQLAKVDELQRKTIQKEKELTEVLAAHQETVADPSMVELSHAVSEMMMNGREDIGGGSGVGGESVNGRVESVLAPKEEVLQDVLQEADDLRLGTIKGVVEILTPIQAVHLLIAGAELHLRIHEWGKKRDVTAQPSEVVSV
ncbi:hypothetical protein Dimus_021598 [Dionaea muscipula]